MALKTTVLFDKPQKEIAAILNDKIWACERVSIVTGFITVEGVKVLLPAICSEPKKLKALVVGAGTYRGFDALDELLNHGVSNNCLYIHLGHTRLTASGARHSFYRYHPMLHSKVFLFEMANDEAVAFVGSHNITGFALLGLNGEASVMLEGKITDPEIQKIKHHIYISQGQSIQYLPSKKDAYAWWTKQFLDGLLAKVKNDIPKDFESAKTIVFLGVKSENISLKEGDVIYFEIPRVLKQIRALEADVHVYILQSVPSSPQSALSSIKYERKGFVCKVSGVEVECGGVELQADWYIPDRYSPTLSPTPKPFRPDPTPNMQQVRVTVKNEIRASYEYLFDTGKGVWEPEIDSSEESEDNISYAANQSSLYEIEDLLTKDDNFWNHNFVQISSNYKGLIDNLNLVPPESKKWFRVYDLHPEDSRTVERSELRDWSPESNSFILISLRRRKRS